LVLLYWLSFTTPHLHLDLISAKFKGRVCQFCRMPDHKADSYLVQQFWIGRNSVKYGSQELALPIFFFCAIYNSLSVEDLQTSDFLQFMLVGRIC
jgi:hypothetical protein